MIIRWGAFWAKSRKPLRVCWLITAGLVALCIGIIRPQERARGIGSESGTGLASVAGVGWEPISLWRQGSILPRLAHEASVDRTLIGESPGSLALQNASLKTYASGGGVDEPGEAASGRKLVRTANLNLVVKSPAQSLEFIVQLAQNSGGFIVTSQVGGGANSLSAFVAIRVPASKFEAVCAQIRQLATRIDVESTGGQDVTKQYVDQEARLRNLRAQEQQYLGILRRAATVKDTLEVSGKLDEVRGAIEEKQAEFDALSKQVETVAINVALRAEADAQIFGLHWRPLYQLKLAARDGLNGIGTMSLP